MCTKTKVHNVEYSRAPDPNLGIGNLRLDRKSQVKVVEQENVIACLREEIAGKASIEAKHLRAADELQIQTTRCEELEKEVVRLKGFKEKLEQAGEMKKRLNEKEQELDKMLEQVFLAIHS